MKHTALGPSAPGGHYYLKADMHGQLQASKQASEISYPGALLLVCSEDRAESALNGVLPCLPAIRALHGTYLHGF
jgi:hypothetical protein